MTFLFRLAKVNDIEIISGFVYNFQVFTPQQTINFGIIYIGLFCW